jgi:hypothetical protein
MFFAKRSSTNVPPPWPRTFRPFVLNLVRDDIDLAEDVFTFELAAASGH